MSDKPKILIQFDCDQHPSVFDSVVAVDSGVQQLLPFGNIEPVDVRELVHGAIFTRGPDTLRHTAIFIGGSNVSSAQQILRSVVDCFFGPVRVSVMMDANGANTTAAAAVLCLKRHLDPRDKTVAVLAATGSVGRRAAELLADLGACVRIGSRSLDRANRLCDQLKKKSPDVKVVPFECGSPHEFTELVTGCDAVLSAGASSIRLLKEEQWRENTGLDVAIDLNAVPPSGIEGIEVSDSGKAIGGTFVYGAIGVGNLKMKIHKQSIRQLFESNDQVLDLQEIFRIGQKIETEND